MAMKPGLRVSLTFPVATSCEWQQSRGDERDDTKRHDSSPPVTESDQKPGCFRDNEENGEIVRRYGKNGDYCPPKKSATAALQRLHEEKQ